MKGKSDRHREDSKHYFRRWKNEVEEVQLTVSSATAPRGSHGYMRARRG
jgi:hypothetical protein